MKRLLYLLTLLCCAALGLRAATVTDELTATGIGLETSYASKNYTGNSGAVYNVIAMTDKSSTYIQFNNGSKTDVGNYGIITTASGGKARKVTISWNSSTGTANKTVAVYGNNTAYTSTSELYETSPTGTKIGTLTVTKGATVSLDITDDYTFIGLVSEASVLYADKIEIEWEQGSATQVQTPVISTSGTVNRGGVFC